MATKQALSKNGIAARTALYGAVTVALYAAVFINQETVMTYFTRGSWYAALPIATVFVFSFAHGAFASNLWSLLGIEARKQPTVRPAVEKPAYERKQPRPRARLNA
jgi:hypothetical protein